MGFVPAYSWFASRVDRMKLVFGVTTFFVVNILLFAVALQAGVGHIGVFFYVWVGLFSLSIIAQFWSYANDIYSKDAGNRLFPIIGVGGMFISSGNWHPFIPENTGPGQFGVDGIMRAASIVSW